MGVLSELDWELKDQPELEKQVDGGSFTLGEAVNEVSAADKEIFDDDARQQAEADTAQAALSLLNGETSPVEIETAADPKPSEDQKKKEHDANEAKRKAEWEAKQAEKKAAFNKALQELLALSDDEVMNASVKRAGDDLERLTRRNMKMCVTEVVQTKCLDDPAFARMVCHPRKSLINCFKYIYKKAEEFVKQELEMNGEKAIGAMVEDVPDDLCYQWAEEYFRDQDAEVDKDKDDKFVPKQYYGTSSSSKTKKEKVQKPKPKPVSEKKSEPDNGQTQLDFGSVAV